jgi:uncharacterized protein (DUF2267 family)
MVPSTPPARRGSPEARAERHASRAGTTYARFIRNIADAGGYTMDDAARFAVGVIATLEERLPIRDVCGLEAQLPTRLDEILSFQPLLGLPAMDRHQFRERVAERLSVNDDDAEAIAKVVFGVLRARISEGEARHVEARLPGDLRELWREGAARGSVPTT